MKSDLLASDLVLVALLQNVSDWFLNISYEERILLLVSSPSYCIPSWQPSRHRFDPPCLNLPSAINPLLGTAAEVLTCLAPSIIIPMLSAAVAAFVQMPGSCVDTRGRWTRWQTSGWWNTMEKQQQPSRNEAGGRGGGRGRGDSGPDMANVLISELYF